MCPVATNSKTQERAGWGWESAQLEMVLRGISSVKAVLINLILSNKNYETMDWDWECLVRAGLLFHQLPFLSWSSRCLSIPTFCSCNMGSWRNNPVYSQSFSTFQVVNSSHHLHLPTTQRWWDWTPTIAIRRHFQIRLLLNCVKTTSTLKNTQT